MSESNSVQPDIEVYIKNLNLTGLIDWLEGHFDHVPSQQLSGLSLDSSKPFTTFVHKGDETIELMITPCAAGKAYTSIWFKSSRTGWSNDLECADSVLSNMETEVRCSASGWTEEEPEFSEKWWKLTRESRDLVSWG